MKIKSLHIKNYRVFHDQFISFDKYTVLVGPNGVGKSTVLSALNVLFREKDHSATDTSYLEEQDFHRGRISDPVEIIATFNDLSEEAKKGLSHYVRQDELIVAAVATYDASTGKAEVKQYGERFGIEDFAPFFLAQGDGRSVSDLKLIYA